MKFLLLITSLLYFSINLASADQLTPQELKAVNPGSSFPAAKKFYQESNIDIEQYPNIVITLSESKKSFSCHLDTISKIYICPNGHSPILVKYDFAGFSALGKEDGSNTKMLSISNVKASEKVLLNSSPMAIEGNFVKPGKDLNKMFTQVVMPITGFLGGFNNNMSLTNLPPGSDEFQKIARDLIQERDDFTELLKKVSQEKNFNVELEDGQKINCSRENRKMMSPDQQNLYNNYNCGSFKCDSITIAGEQFQTSMIYDSTAGSFTGATLHLTNKDKIAPQVIVKNLTTSLTPIPVLDNSASIENSKLPKPAIHESSPEEKVQLGIQDPLPDALPENLEKIKDRINMYQDPNFDMLLQMQKVLCSNEQGALDNTLAAKDVILNEVANTKMAQFIGLLSDGSLLGQFIDPNQAGKYGCFYKGAYLNEAAAKNLDKIKKNINPEDNVEQTISLERANQLFTKAQNMKDIAWNYKADGCYARAHLMARRFENEGVRVDKVWIKGNLYVPGTVPEISWNFHVAPIVYVKNAQGKIDKMVIDPSLFDHPVTVDEWDQKISKRTKIGSVVTRFPFPENTMNMERSTLAFSSSDPYLPGDKIQMSESEKMDLAQKTMAEYIKIPAYTGMGN